MKPEEDEMDFVPLDEPPTAQEIRYWVRSTLKPQ